MKGGREQTPQKIKKEKKTKKTMEGLMFRLGSSRKSSDQVK